MKRYTFGIWGIGHRKDGSTVYGRVVHMQGSELVIYGEETKREHWFNSKDVEPADAPESVKRKLLKQKAAEIAKMVEAFQRAACDCDQEES